MTDWTPETLFCARLRSRLVTDAQARLLTALAGFACWSDDDGLRIFVTAKPSDLRRDAGLGVIAFHRALYDLRSIGAITILHVFPSGITSYGVELRNVPARRSLPALTDDQTESETYPYGEAA